MTMATNITFLRESLDVYFLSEKYKMPRITVVIFLLLTNT